MSAAQYPAATARLSFWSGLTAATAFSISALAATFGSIPSWVLIHVPS